MENHKNMTKIGGGRNAIETDSEIKDLLELTDRDFRQQL